MFGSYRAGGLVSCRFSRSDASRRSGLEARLQCFQRAGVGAAHRLDHALQRGGPQPDAVQMPLWDEPQEDALHKARREDALQNAQQEDALQTAMRDDALRQDPLQLALRDDAPREDPLQLALPEDPVKLALLAVSVALLVITTAADSSVPTRLWLAARIV